MMKRLTHRTLALTAGLLLAAGAPALSQTPGFALPTAPDEHPVTAKLLIDHQAARPGQTVTVGLLLSMPRHWHVYWKNPGESGMATQVAWQLPDRWEAGPLRWPVPRKFDQPGSVVGYGYEKAVLLTSRVEVPADARIGGTVEIGVTANWLACKDLCIAGDARLVTALPITETPGPANKALFDRWSHRLPKPMEDQGPVTISRYEVNPTGKATWQVEATMQWSQPVGAVQWYPGASGDWLIEQIQIDHRGPTTGLRFIARHLAGKPEPAAPLGFDSLIIPDGGEAPQAWAWHLNIAGKDEQN